MSTFTTRAELEAHVKEMARQTELDDYADADAFYAVRRLRKQLKALDAIKAVTLANAELLKGDDA